MKRSHVTSVCTLVAAVAIGAGRLPAETAQTGQPNLQRPNIVLMMSDDQGFEETGYNRHPVLKTPHLDRMAAAGLRFDRFYTGGSNCSPTRGTIMTGRNHNRYGLFEPNYAMRPEERTLAQLLKQAGYATGQFGKWHLGAVKGDSPNNPGKMGFDEWLSHDNFYEMDPVFSRNGAPPTVHKGESSMIVANAALEFIKANQSTGKPFFILVWYGSPHSPYVALPEDEALYASVENANQRRRFAEITAMDRAIGHFRDELGRLGVGSNTMFWFNSDNGVPGDGLLQPTLKGSKRTYYENGIKVPGILEWPARIPKPRSTAVPFVTTDLMPTILDLLNLPIPTDRPLDGISMRGLIEGRMTERPRPIGGYWLYAYQNEPQNERWIPAPLQRGTTPTANNPAIDFLNFKHPVAKTSDFGGEAAAWMTNDYKLIYLGTTGRGRGRAGAGGAAPTEPVYELYDISTDPGETKNLAASHPEIVARLRKDLETWQASVEISLTGADYRATK